MEPNRWQAVEALLDKALDAGPEHWAEVVRSGSAGDDALRDEVMSLLAHHPRTHEFLLRGAAGVMENLERPEALLAAGTTIGPWRVIEEIGRGGMSRVYRGERSDGAFEQAVAIKILRAGLDSAIDVDRFRRERQILAALEHPNIARLLDGGTTADGRPYLVLELVDGEPIHDWCSARQLTTRDRVRLGVTVARAVAHAHRQLVIHRDLKPTNILVTQEGNPKLLDFGIAKLLDAGGTSTDTATRHRWLSPGYAAPEQVRGEVTTTATDVYQLGVVLFELLTGRRPIEVTAQPYELAVLQQDPVRPSTVRSELAGDLDAILLKALRPSPSDRYQSADELADDLERIERREPVRAREGERAYQVRRFLARRARLVATAVAAVGAVGAYTATVARQNQRISLALAESNRLREKADRTTWFLVDLFRSQTAEAGSADSVPAAMLIARGEAVARARTHDPGLQAAMLEVLGVIRGDMGADSAARANFVEALAIARGLPSASQAELAHFERQIADVDVRLRNLDSAESGFRRALAVQRRVLGDTATATRYTMLMLALAIHARQGDEANALIDEWERLSKNLTIEPDPEVAQQFASMADLLGYFSDDSTQLARAEWYARARVKIYEQVYGGRGFDMADALEQLGWIRSRQGHPEDALALMRRSLAEHEALFPQGHRSVASTHEKLGTALRDMGKPDSALVHYAAALQMTVRLEPSDTLVIAGLRHVYGDALSRTGRHREAIRELQRSIAEFQTRVSPGSGLLGATRISLAGALAGDRRYREAEHLLRSVYETLRAKRGMRDRITLRAADGLVDLYDRLGRASEAAQLRAVVSEARSLPVPSPVPTPK